MTPTGKLDGLTILVPESRELDLFAGMLEAEGAEALRCPLVQILDLEDTTDARIWIDRLIQSPFDDLILMTGEGLKRLVAIAEGANRRHAFVAALPKCRIITRGPKPARVLRELGLTSDLAAATPTSQGVFDALANEDLKGRRVGVQNYPGAGSLPLIAALRDRSADVFPITPYRYASQAESACVAETIRALAAGRIGMVAFTSSPQVERLALVAREFGLQDELALGLARTKVASIGPIVEQTLEAHGVSSVIQPQANFHLRPLVKAIIAAWSARSEADSRA